MFKRKLFIFYVISYLVIGSIMLGINGEKSLKFFLVLPLIAFIYGVINFKIFDGKDYSYYTVQLIGLPLWIGAFALHYNVLVFIGVPFG